MTKKSKIFGRRNKGLKSGRRVEIIGERKNSYIIIDQDGWSLYAYETLMTNLHKDIDLYDGYEDISKSTCCLFVPKEHITLWHYETKLGELL